LFWESVSLVIILDGSVRRFGETFMLRRTTLTALLLVGLWSGVRAQAPPSDPDQTLLNRAGVGTEDAALLKLVRTRTHVEVVDPQRLEDLIARLGDEDFPVRERASAELRRLGRASLPALLKHADHRDPEVRQRVGQCIEDINAGLDPTLTLAAVRLLLRHRADGAAEALLAYLPDAQSEVEEEIFRSLEAVARAHGRTEPALRAALTDPHPSRRAAAALTLARLGGDDRDAARAALNDPHPLVRLRASQGFLASRDAAAVPVLIGVLDAEEIEIAWQAEELLVWLADHARRRNYSPLALHSAAERRTVREEWRAWWETNGKIDWARLDADHRRPGLILVCDNEGVWLCGCDSRPRWRLDRIGSPSDAQLLPGARLLVADGDRQAVTEYDLVGNARKSLWQRRFANGEVVLGCERLADGRTLLVTDEMLVMVGRGDGDLFSYTPPNGESIADAQFAGPYRLLILLDRAIVELDSRSGALVGQTQLPRGVTGSGNRLTALPNDQILVVDNGTNHLVVLDRTGKVVSKRELPNALSATLLRNNNYLVSAIPNEPRVAEMTPDGRIVWEAFPESPSARARPCLSLLQAGLDRPRPADLNLDTVPYRVKALKDPEVTIRRRSALFLGEFGEKAVPAVPALVEALADEDEEVRRRCSAALAAVGEPAVPALIKALRHQTNVVRLEAARTLEELGSVARAAVPELTALLGDAGADVALRQHCAAALGAVGAEAAPAVPTLLRTIRAEQPALRDQSARALGRIGAVTPEVVPALLAALKDDQVLVRTGAATGLGLARSSPKEAVPALVEALRTREVKSSTEGDVTQLRQSAAAALASFGPQAAPAVEPLAEVIKDPREPSQLRRACLGALGRMKEAAKPALPAIAELLKEPAPPLDLTRTALQTLAALGPDGVAVLATAVKEGGTNTRRLAIQTLSNMGANAAPALPALEQAAKDPNASIAGAAQRAIQRIKNGGGMGPRGK
jgi:HEAT repeat protein